MTSLPEQSHMTAQEIAEESLQLLEKQQMALKSLNLSDQDRMKLESELMALGWPTDFEHVHHGKAPPYLAHERPAFTSLHSTVLADIKSSPVG